MKSQPLGQRDIPPIITCHGLNHADLPHDSHDGDAWQAVMAGWRFVERTRRAYRGNIVWFCPSCAALLGIATHRQEGAA